MNGQNTPRPQHGDHSVWWWMGWITLTIVTFFIACAFWTPFIAKHVGTMNAPAAPVWWVTAVFGTWMVFLVPLIIVMYNKVDRAYEDARIQREKITFEKKSKLSPVRSVFIPEQERLLSDSLAKKVKKMPLTIKRGHLVHVILNNGRKVENVFILDDREVLGVYGHQKAPFQVSEIADILAVDLDGLPAFETGQWLLLDGAGSATS